jgi:hypothetical protein
MSDSPYRTADVLSEAPAPKPTIPDATPDEIRFWEAVYVAVKGRTLSRTRHEGLSLRYVRSRSQVHEPMLPQVCQ